MAVELNSGAQASRPVDEGRIEHARRLPDRTVGDRTAWPVPRVVKNRFLTEKEQKRGLLPRPGALVRRYPNADHEWAWQWIFRTSRDRVDPNSGKWVRFHLHESYCRTHVLNRDGRGVQNPAARLAVPVDALSRPSNRPSRGTGHEKPETSKENNATGCGTPIAMARGLPFRSVRIIKKSGARRSSLG